MKVFVIHADRLKERGEYMDHMLKRFGIDYEFINEGRSEEKTQAYIDQYLKDGREPLHQKTPRGLCTISHFLVYERILSEGFEGALVLEDDIALHRHFVARFEQSIQEFRERYANHRVLISYEDSTLRFIPRSQREKNRMLYPADKGRTAGAYFINNLAAKAILEQLKAERCDVAIDLYHNELIQNHVIDCLWSQPAIATQGSFTGAIPSSLVADDHFIRLRWFFKKNYKRLLYWLR